MKAKVSIKTVSLVLSLLMVLTAVPIIGISALAEPSQEQNLLAGMGYTLTLNAFRPGFEDTEPASLLTDGAYRGDGIHDWNQDDAVKGVSIESVGSRAETSIEFKFEEATAIGSVVIKSARAFINRYCHVVLVSVTTDGMNYTDLYDAEADSNYAEPVYQAIEGAPESKTGDESAVEPQFFDIIVNVDPNAAKNVKGLKVVLDTMREDGSSGYIAQFDEIEAYGSNIDAVEFSVDESSVTPDESSQEPESVAPITYTVTLRDNGDGTAEMTATIPENICSGKIVITQSADLTYIKDSLMSDVAGAAVNESYNRGGVSGQCVAFASADAIAAGTVAFKASYAIKDGAELDVDDIVCNLWNLTNGSKFVGTEKDGSVIKTFKPAPVKPASVTYTVTLTDRGDGTATITAVIPENVAAGKIVITPSENLTLIPNSLKGDVSNFTPNENYNRAGITGQCVAFASSEIVPAGTVAFTANYAVKEGAKLSADDIICNLWNLSDGKVKIGTEKDGDVIKVFETVSLEPAPVTYTVTLTDNGDGTATMTAVIPENVCSGKIVITPSENLTFVPGSLKGDVPNFTPNESYNRDGTFGQCSVFAGVSRIPAGTVAFTANYAVKEGAKLSADDIICRLWNLSDGAHKIGTEMDGSVVKVFVPAPEYPKGDVNFDEYVDNTDAAIMLQYDAGLMIFTKLQLKFGDVDWDNFVDNVDAVLVLQLDAGIIFEFPKK